MAITTAYAPVREQGNGVKVDFDFTFKIFNASDLVVGKLLRSTEAETACTLGVDYTVTINTVTEGGTVTYTVAPTALQDSFIRRNIPTTQPEVIPSSSIFREAQLNTALDRGIMILQQVWVSHTRCIKLPETWTGGAISVPAPEAGKYLVWNTAEDALENADLPDPSILVKAETADAEAATDDAKFMTAAKVKAEVQKSGAVTIPIANVTGHDAAKEDVSNKDVTATLGTSDTKYPSQKAVKTYVDTQVATKALGDWVDKSASHGAQVAATDGFVTVTTANSASSTGYTDAAADPSTVRGYSDVGGGTIQSYTFPVKKGHSWKVTVACGNIAVGWIPFGV
ncbi:MAG: hypothetical protein WC551_10505 [Patescibacteria group bacterium]